MDAKLKAKWVKALRSGEYQQANGKLKRDGGYCCLGVVCVVAGYGIDTSRDFVIRPGGSFIEDDSYGPITDLGLDCHVRSTLISMNDEGRPFSEIADYIEANIPAEVSA